MHYKSSTLMVHAQLRGVLHKGGWKTRPYTDNPTYVGLLGEAEFAREFGLEVDLELKREGDGHIDFDTSIGTIDVKTARKPWYLLMEKGSPHADIMVLAQLLEDEKVVLLGWEWGSEMEKMPAKKWGYPLVSHYKVAKRLKPIEDLAALIDIQNWINSF
jgi:hypothetical protein